MDLAHEINIPLRLCSLKQNFSQHNLCSLFHFNLVPLTIYKFLDGARRSIHCIYTHSDGRNANEMPGFQPQ
jgi:hypothetical protein